MPDPNRPYYAYHYDAGSHAERAQRQLQLFDAENLESLFYAAFELRTGIEARLYEGAKGIIANQSRRGREKETYPEN